MSRGSGRQSSSIAYFCSPVRDGVSILGEKGLSGKMAYGVIVGNDPVNGSDPLGLCPDDPLPKDPIFKKLIDDLWLESTPLGISGWGMFGAHEHYGFLISSGGTNTASGPFRATTSTGGYHSKHGTSDPSGTIAGAHAHWSNRKYPSPGDVTVAKTRNRPEYIITKDGLTRVNTDGSVTQLARDGASRCSCLKK